MKFKKGKIYKYTPGFQTKGSEYIFYMKFMKYNCDGDAYFKLIYDTDKIEKERWKKGRIIEFKKAGGFHTMSKSSKDDMIIDML